MRVHYWELSNYNNGRLIGKWFDLDGASKDDHYSELQEWLAELTESTGSLCEEWIIGDTEGIPLEYVNEYSLDSELFEYIEQIDNGVDSEVLQAGLSIGIPLDSIIEAYSGEFSSNIDFAMDYWEMSGYLQDVPNHAIPYLDWEAIARDLLINDFTEHNGHYFSNNY